MKATWLTRLDRLERAEGGDWRHGHGLSSLLRAFQAEEGGDVDEDEEPLDLDLESTPMGRLLAEARRWTEARRAAQGEP
jgi:hypothetical protein